ncbi:tyrosine-type recombinase/integrase [Flavobacterium sp. GT3R68]|uniref:tyrosine-type recombinase/integrase n=1 Tax=Flavobacterium sp. GT3R68 TaxID=2594437 RepID=UPI000F875159|nr:tyrosine-type recombinase/integrase [Flavobacterium sp. GT3R68]RTY90266.1 integrase [Flavobacterium sp. GSN2]TRW90567.1 tyrosine-type recombinase/integrase [Flavobacterium sp. GT3R68]
MENSKTAFREYLQLEKNYSPHTVHAYLNDVGFFETFVITNFYQESLLEVNYNLIRSWIVSLVDADVSNVSVNRKISSLKSYYKFLLKTKQIEVSPLLKHKSLKTAKSLQIPFSEKELNRVLTEIKYPDGFEGIRDKLMIDLFYTTGIRRTELIHLKMENIDLSNSTLKVLGKRNKERILPLLPIIRDQFSLYLSERSRLKTVKDEVFFFLTLKGVKLNDSLVYRLINDYFSNVSEKVKKSPHILRHTFATHLLNNGADLNSVKELLGHSSLASTQVYTHSSLAELKKVYGAAHPRSQK